MSIAPFAIFMLATFCSLPIIDRLCERAADRRAGPDRADNAAARRPAR